MKRRNYDPLALDACAGLMGGIRTLDGTDQDCELFNLSREDNIFGTQPRLLSLSIDVGMAEPFGAGEIDLRGEVRWATGSGKGIASFDVAASGAVLTVVGSDGIRVKVFRTGANTSTIKLRGTLAVAVGGQAVPAQRTLVDLLPIAARVAIPKYAQSVNVMSDVGGGLLGVDIEYFAEPGAGVAIGIVPADIGPQPIPIGAQFYNFTAAAPAQTVRAIWGLRLA